MIVLTMIDTNFGLHKINQLTVTMTGAVIAQQLFLPKTTTLGLILPSLQILGGQVVLISRKLTILPPHLLPPISLLQQGHPAERRIPLDLLPRIHSQAIIWPLLIRTLPPYYLRKCPTRPRAILQHHHHLQDERNQTTLTPDHTQTDGVRRPPLHLTTYLAVKTLEEARGNHILLVPPNLQHNLWSMPQRQIGLLPLKMHTLNDRKIVTRNVIDIENRGRIVKENGPVLNTIGIDIVKSTDLKPIGRRTEVLRTTDTGNQVDSEARKGWNQILKAWGTQTTRPRFPFLVEKATSPLSGSLSAGTGDNAQTMDPRPQR
jgi:hypothetical protein